jgi:hypothetical protein
MHKLNREKSCTKVWTASVIFDKLPKVNTHPTGLNSPNLVTLTDIHRKEKRPYTCMFFATHVSFVRRGIKDEIGLTLKNKCQRLEKNWARKASPFCTARCAGHSEEKRASFYFQAADRAVCFDCSSDRAVRPHSIFQQFKSLLTTDKAAAI